MYCRVNEHGKSESEVLLRIFPFWFLGSGARGGGDRGGVRRALAWARWAADMALASLHLDPLWSADWQSAGVRQAWARESAGVFARAAATDLTHLLALITRLHKVHTTQSGARAHVLQALMAHFRVGDEHNWLEALHERVKETVPPALLRLYPHGVLPTEDEFRVMTAVAHDPGTEPVGRGELYQRVLKPYRERGYAVVGRPVRAHSYAIAVHSLPTICLTATICRPPSQMRHYQVLIQGVIEHAVGFAIPTREALDVIVRHASPRGVVEMGAGTGFWAAMLSDHGVDVLAFDRDPPTDDESNAFFGAGTYAEVSRGDAASLLRASAAWPADAAEALYARTLLLVWPNNPDLFDNQHLVAAPQRAALQKSSAATPPWDAECLSSYLEAGGESVVYVGEREESVQALLPKSATHPDCGLSASRRFQRMLNEHFVLVEQVHLPSWWLHVDDLTVWRRRDAVALTC